MFYRIGWNDIGELRNKATDHHQPYVTVVSAVIPLARHVRTGLHRRRGYTTQPVERRHVSTRDRLRGTRGLRTVGTDQR
jgi:hypothetical protein